MRRVTVDTNILIWGVRGFATAGQEDKIGKARLFFEWLDRAKDELVLTAPAISEFLVGGTPESRARQMRELSDSFQILPFDAAAAETAAELRSDAEFISRLGVDTGKTRVCIKADIAIVATALAGKVQQMFSDDRGLRAVATRGGLSCLEMPGTEVTAPPESATPETAPGDQRSRNLDFGDADPV